MTALRFTICCLLVFSAMGDVWLHWDQKHTAVEWAILWLDCCTKLAAATLIFFL